MWRNGRRARLRGVWSNPWGFKSPHRHFLTVIYMDKKELIKRCLIFEDALETYPFKDKTYEEYAVLRHKSYRFSGQFRCVYIGYDAELLLV